MWLRSWQRTFGAAKLAADVGALWLARTGLSLAGGPAPSWRLWTVGGALWLISLHVLGGYDSYRARRPWALLGPVAGAGLAVAAGVGALAFYFGQHPDPGVVVTWIALSAWALCVDRLLIRQASRRARRPTTLADRQVLVLGTGERAQAMARALDRGEHWGFALAGRLEEPGQLSLQLAQQVVDEVVIALEPPDEEAAGNAIACCREQGVDVHLLSRQLEVEPGRARVTQLAGVSLIHLASTPAFRARMLAKRLFDIALSGALLLLSSPVMALIALAVRWDSPGPALFRQRRAGLHGRPFVCLKFRSMEVGAEGRLEELLSFNEVDGPAFKMTADPRITRLGHWLRRSSLDELPQLFNVLVGEMSIVGPRPPLLTEVAEYEGWQRRRLSVRPGLTGLWQVSGRNDLPFDEWMRLDLEYIDRWSMWLDLEILLRTIPAVLSGRGAR